MRRQPAPWTEGVKYAGSKLKLLPAILEMVASVKPKLILDGFAGTTRVSQALAQSGYCVIANDAAVWSRVFGACYLLNKKPAEYFQPMIDHLNQLPGVDGWFTEHYGGPICGGSMKKPWQIHNTRKLDAIRGEIDRLAMPEPDKSVLLTSLMLALDAVDSTVGHHASYLKNWSPRSSGTLELKVPHLIPRTEPHAVHQANIFDLLPHLEVDLAYFDPPYGSNNEKMPPSRVRYAAYYHLWTTVCLNDKPPLFGRANRRLDSSDSTAPSPFEDYRKSESGKFVAVEAIERMLQQTRARHILLSYSSGGRATAEELAEAIQKAGRILKTLEINYRRNVMSAMRWTNEWVRDASEPNKEFLFLIERQ